MKEIWELAISPAMLPLTILLVPVGLYWILTLVGIAGHGISHGHGHGHVSHHGGGHHGGGHHGPVHGAHGAAHGPGHAHGHAHAHSHTHGQHHHGQGEHHFFADLLQGALRVVNAEEMPVMGVLSVLILFLWGGAMLGNYWFNPGSSGSMGALVILGALVSAVIFTRLVLTPLKPLFKFLQNDPEPEAPLIGRTGYVRTAFVDEKYGQVVVDNRGAPIIVGARTAQDSEPIERNAHVLLVSRDEDSGLYVVRSAQ
ncbi:hypothetical protein [Luteolibacter soli]|uniref:DUF1449 family protein n=1 Tax=Luteolibacter soli TaxID=3135280 RepID=A0ABU9B386_9BACT